MQKKRRSIARNERRESRQQAYEQMERGSSPMARAAFLRKPYCTEEAGIKIPSIQEVDMLAGKLFPYLPGTRVRLKAGSGEEKHTVAGWLIEERAAYLVVGDGKRIHMDRIGELITGMEEQG